MPTRPQAPRDRPGTPPYRLFRAIIERNNRILDTMADIGEKLGGEFVFDRKYVVDIAQELETLTGEQINDFTGLRGRRSRGLEQAYAAIGRSVQAELRGRHRLPGGAAVLPLSELDGSSADVAGNKMADLAHLRNKLQLAVPDGFVITARAFEDFMNTNGLTDLAQRLAAAAANQAAGLEEAAETMRRRIMNAALPRRLAKAISSQFDGLAAREKQPALRVSLRSSAWEENAGASFAGQYATVLNVARHEIPDAYRFVIASAYEPAAWRYRLEKGYREHELLMAVGCQVMAGSTASGVLHTLAPHIGRDSMVINGAWGLCERVVQGKQDADTFVVSRTPPHDLQQSDIVQKDEQLEAPPDGGVRVAPVPPEIRGAPCLTAEQRAELAKNALLIERYYKSPQEIEWTFDGSGRLFILQARTLRFQGRKFNPGTRVDQTLRRADVVFVHAGTTAQCGIGLGEVFIMDDDRDLSRVPFGCILACRYASPRYGSIMPKIRGIIAETGSPTGHMATLAREYRIPAIVNAGPAMRLLKDGEPITLDATQSTVYRGYLYDLSRFELTEEEVFEDTGEYRLLRRLADHVSRLTCGPEANGDFRPSDCRTYHDVIHYIRVHAVEAFIRVSEEAKIEGLSGPKRLSSDIPLGLLVVDAGGGTDCPDSTPAVSREQIVCAPLRAFLDGINDLGMWCTTPVSVDLGSFMSSFTRTFCTSLSSPQEIGRNLAVVLQHYMDIHLRLGYHFTVMDSYLSETVDDNYINFRFFGGVTEFVRRSRRATFIARVLEHFDFLVHIRGDLVTARLKKLALVQMRQRMRMLGGLVGYTRQLDALLDSDHDVARHAELFITAIQTAMGEHYEQ